MTKTFTSGFQSMLNSARNTLATCILITRQDGAVYGFTTHDRSFVYSGVTYYPAFSFRPADVATANNMDTDNTQATGLLDSSTITVDDLRAGKWDAANYRLFQVNWENLTQGDKKDRTGQLSQVTAGRQEFVAELLGLMDFYGAAIGEVSTPGCRANLGDRRCKVDLVGGSPSFTVTGTVSAANADLFTFDDNARTEATGYFTEGVVTFTSGLLSGLSYEVKSYTLVTSAGGVFITKTPLAYDATGCTYSVHAGCDKQRTTCRDRFSNVVNFRGEPWRRGQDVLAQVGRHSE